MAAELAQPVHVVGHVCERDRHIGAGHSDRVDRQLHAGRPVGEDLLDGWPGPPIYARWPSWFARSWGGHRG